ncbi:MAG: aminotransferase DegT [Nanoarchaeota archaeon]|nr:aminotransferase DegT [Nanoarchaeota archaeon]|tara:strand:- start:3117 stop:4238 length:1122 start_codon:yes stop_codon:yes gene_type:complete
MIRVCEPTLSGNEAKYVQDCLQTTMISSMGDYIKKFEHAFATYSQVKHGVAVSNGTTAIHLALEALGIGPGDEVIIPTFTMIATGNAVLYTGATPVFVDAELDTWNMDTSQIESKITEKTKAIIPVHTYGHPCDMDRINDIAKKHNLFVIEDAAEAHGAEYKGRKAGSLSDVACFSFYANKMITTGEGGMVITNNDQIAEKCRLLRNHAFVQPRFVHHQLGFNYRMTNIQAAMGLAQTENIQTFVESRIKNAQRYTELLKDVQGIECPPKKEWAKNVYWMYGILLNKSFPLSKDQLMAALRERGIGTRSFFHPLHAQPMFNNPKYKHVDTSGNFQKSQYLWQNGLYLPSSSHLTDAQIQEVVNAIKEIARNNL